MKSATYSRILLLAGLLATPGFLQAQPSAHYVPGVEGIKAASLPPPGVYFRDYNVIYYADRLNDATGNNVSPPTFHAFTYANVPRVIWITDTTFLGGNVGVDALLPLEYQNVKVPGFDHGTFGIGDLFAETTVSWHVDQFDYSIGAGLWAPTGDSPSKTPQQEISTRAGLGYWTPMLTFGATWYIDSDKTWALSALNRYEFNSDQNVTKITPGQAYTLEWGLSKTLVKVLDLGVVGYYQQQTTSNQGPGASTDRNRVAAIGPEVNVAIPSAMTSISLRYLNEFMAESRAQGDTVTLTVTKRF